MMMPFGILEQDIPPLICLVLVMIIPIVAILARHQQKMAMILRQPGAGAADQEAIYRLAAEVRELRAMVAQQTVALDSLAVSNQRLSQRVEGPAVESRVSV